MYKKGLIVLLVLLSGCSKVKQYACVYKLENKEIDLDIKAINDDISSINVRACFEIPNSVMANKEYIDNLNKQLNEQFHYEDNILVREYEVQLDDTYSLQLTLDYLRDQRYFCE